MWKFISIFSVLIAGIVGQSPEILPTVNLIQGTVVGSVAPNANYYEFYGIPYADATSGGNRFKGPNPPPSFQETFYANRRDVKCIRALGVGYEGTEDCLVANIFTRDLQSRLPVMVWVKGKEFDRNNEFEPSFGNFVETNVVVVTLNYRESVLGFLCLGTDAAPGNAGLKDIVAGLTWVQQNIEHFGGNPNDITLVGHGSGAAAVDLVTLSPMANGLVHKAISQSGNALSPWAVTRDNFEYAIKVAEALGHVVTDAEQLSGIYMRTSVPALMGVINELELTDNSLAFAPCIENESLNGSNPFLIKSPYEILQDGDYARIPMIIGYVDNEGTIRSEEAIEDNWLDRMNSSFTEFLQPDLKFTNDIEEAQIAGNIKSYYFEDNAIDLNNIEDYISYHGDTMILVSTLREVRLRTSFGTTAPVYLYQFSYKGSIGEPFVGPVPVESAAHSEELAYMFYDTLADSITSRDIAIGSLLVERWTNFVKFGIPLSVTSTTIWSPYTSSSESYLRILDNDEINELSSFELPLQNPHPQTMSFWDQIYEEHFLDAESRWDLSERDDDANEEDNENGSGGGSGENGSGEDNNGEDGSGEDGSGEHGNGEDGNSGDGNGEDANGEDGSNSASTAIGFTFSIITLFAILNQFHSVQIIS